MKKKHFNVLLLIVCLALLASSCSTTKKLRAKETVKTETIAVAATDTGTVSKTDAVKHIAEDSSFTNKSHISIIFENEAAPGDEFAPISDDYYADTPAHIQEEGEKENEYEAAPLKKKEAPPAAPRIFTYTVNNNTISSSRPIKSIDLVDETAGTKKSVDFTQVNTYDSSGASASAKTETQTETQTTIRTKEKVSYTTFIIIGGVVILLFFIFLFIRKKVKKYKDLADMIDGPG